MKEEREETTRGRGKRKREKKKKKNSGVTVLLIFSRGKRNLEHVRSMICAVQSLRPFTMVLCSNDAMAVQRMRTLHEAETLQPFRS